MPPIIEPRDLTLPQEAYYPAETLQLFARDTRATWRNSFGQEPPKWDKARRIKRWADTTALDGLDGLDDPGSESLTYGYLDRASRTFKTFEITAAEAAVPNLPGEFVYPKHLILPTPARVVDGVTGDEQPLNPAIICYHAEATELGLELEGHVVESKSLTDGPFTIAWNGEERRRWLIVFPGSICTAALLLAMKLTAGIGAPGEWVWVEVGDHTEPKWLSHTEETGEFDERPEIPIPCRTLYPQEAIWSGFAGVGAVLIYRTDMQSPYNPRPSRGLTVAQAATLNRIDFNVGTLLQAP